MQADTARLAQHELLAVGGRVVAQLDLCDDVFAGAAAVDTSAVVAAR